MMEQVSEAVEAFRTGFPLAFLAFVPVILLVVSPIAVVDAAHEFKVYRMQQYDLQGNTYGCRSAIVNSEVRTLQSSSFARKCVMIRSDELTHAHYLEVLDRGPSAIVILLRGNMSNDQIQNFVELEEQLLGMNSNFPVYFAHEDDDLEDIYDRVSQSTKVDSGSALQAMIDSATSVGYQVVTSGGQSKSTPDHAIVNIEGVLPGLGIEDQLPTIAIVAHYDSFGVAPNLSYGANSDATGVVALLELARIFGKFYSNSRTHPRHNILFLLSGGGKFNYQGSRKWIEEAIDNAAGSVVEHSSALISNTKLVLCLEALGSRDSNSLKMHVSKPPAKGTVADRIHSNIVKHAASQNTEIDTSLVHKKIRLSSDSLGWEHERFSIRRLHAVTLSSLDAFDDPMRRSIMDTKEKVSVEKLTRNIGIVAESVIRYLYNVTHESDLNFISGDYSVQKDNVQSWLDFLANQPRPAQEMKADHIVVTTLESALQRYVKGVHKMPFKADKRDPEFLFYNGLVQQMSASIVRSAVFDLYVTGAVAGYIAILYFLVVKFNGLLVVAKKFNSLPKVKVQ